MFEVAWVSGATRCPLTPTLAWRTSVKDRKKSGAHFCCATRPICYCSGRKSFGFDAVTEKLFGKI
ncbi:MAG: hypothetical protein AAF958_02735, partial [Planctomycetota bacterium]